MDVTRSPRSDQAGTTAATAGGRLTVGLLVTVVISSFETTATATLMPTALSELNGDSVYGLIFTCYFIAQLSGLALSGWFCNAYGGAVPFAAGALVHSTGLAMCGLSHDVGWLLIGRSVQGAGAGVVWVAALSLIARCYPDRERGRLLGYLSMAWAAPGLLGPVVASAVTEWLGWRVVLLPVAALELVVLALLTPVLRTVGGQPTLSASRSPLWRTAMPVAVIAGGVALVSAASILPRGASWICLVGGVGIVVAGVRPLFPAGALVLRPDLPALVTFRGVFGGLWIGTAFVVPLGLVTAGGWATPAAGAALSCGVVGYAVGGLVHGRRKFPPERRSGVVLGGSVIATIGFLLTALGVGTSVIAFVYVGWLLAGLGTCLATTSLNLEILRLSPTGEQGSNSAALALAEAVTASVVTAFASLVLGPAAGDAALRATAATVFVACAVVILVLTVARSGARVLGRQ